LEAVQTGQRRPSFDLTSAEVHVLTHDEFALQQYGVAIRKMRASLSCGTQNLRTTIISCLLIVAFELFYGNGNHTSALTQASIGLRMIVERMRELRRRTANPDQRNKHLFAEVDEALIQKLVRLDLSSMAFIDENVVLGP
jgi:hypothetical protein